MRYLIAGLLCAIVSMGLIMLTNRAAAQMPSDSYAGTGQTTSFDDESERNIARPLPPLNSTQLISIPYGFDTPLPLDVDEQEIRASGVGACTSGQTVTILVTVTQELSSATASGEKMATCTGDEQPWWAIADIATGPEMQIGTAEACGLAITRQEGEETDRFEWCTDVNLRSFDYLPLLVR
jgi:hypothetical protein